MEKYPSVSPLVLKFSLLWELLPFYGYIPLWRYLLCRLNTQTKQVWVKNQQAFKERAKDMTMKTIKYKGAFDEHFRNYLSNPEILLNNKISIQLSSTQEWINLFAEFLKDLLQTDKRPEFGQINFLECSICTSYFAEPLYNMLKQLGDNQESLIVKNWKLQTTRYVNREPYTNLLHSEIINTEYINNSELLSLPDADFAYYLEFKISKFNVSHIDYWIKYEDPSFFFNNLKIDDITLSNQSWNILFEYQIKFSNISFLLCSISLAILHCK